MKYGIIENGKIVQTLKASYEPAGNEFVAIPDTAEAGQLWDGTTLSDDPTPAPTAAVVITAGEFIDRFTDDEWTDIQTALQNGQGAQAARIRKWFKVAELKNRVEVTDAATGAVLAAAVTAGILTQARADEVGALA